MRCNCIRMEIIECIKNRRSTRSYNKMIVEYKNIELIIKSAIMAPSGKNGQPWRFHAINDSDQIERICDFLKCQSWLKTAGGLIFVFLDRNKSYDYIKDMQSCGAAIQNMLLTAESLGISSCWVGSVASKSEMVNNHFKISENHELVAIITLGYRSIRNVNPGRNKYESFFV